MSFFEPTKWYLVYSKSRKEELAELSLRLKGLDVFLPRLVFPSSVGKTGQIIPLFPNYLFTRIYDAQQYQSVLWTPGVKRLVSFCGIPASLDESVVSFLMRHATPEGMIAARCNLKIGQEVRLTGGAFDGLLGIIQEPPDGQRRVKLLMKLLNREIQVEVPMKFVKADWVPSLSSLNIRSELPKSIN